MRTLSVIVVLLVTSACTTTPVANNELDDAVLPGTVDARQLAADAAKQLQAYYPAASTRFALRQRADAGFPGTLAEALRAAGYELREIPPASSAGTGAADARQGMPADAAPADIPVRYLLGTVDQNGAYYLTLDAGHHRISRAYVLHQDTLRPTGAWLHGELP
ncbi:conjugative transfer protein TrbH [Pseudoduganella lurida]|uniref:Conjugative transfer protein TrbH n=1 Tax=Pseudoduganella lurida TaxID=1036180 RepID=A0A562R142_9BURK|nr:conjugal transfer protein TrbH [Pseudoduganella lurida]TWI62553.1 conjugative transfer protein TrbH [Pseudoduganella lurida]